MLELRKLYPDDEFNVILDERSLNFIEIIYQKTSISVLETDFNIKFIDQKNASKLKIADYSFQLFYGGRYLHDFSDLIYTDDQTITVISNTMHGKSLDEVRDVNSHLFFKPPGVGCDRSGIINSPELNRFKSKNKAQRKIEAAKTFNIPIVKKILNKDQFAEASIGFFYGTHNEIHDSKLIGQTTNYIKNIEKHNKFKNPVILFTANSKDQLTQVIPSFHFILDLNELEKLTQLENSVYVVSLGLISGEQFTGMIAASDVPVLIEGNSAVSTAFRLGTPFLMYRSPWNGIQIRDIIHHESTTCQSCYLGEIYDVLEDSIKPEFNKILDEIYLDEQRALEHYCSLGIQIPDFHEKISAIIDISQKIKNLKTEPLNPEQLSKKYIEISDHAYERTKDEALEYSIIYDAFKRKLILESDFTLKQKNITARGLDIFKMESRFIPNQPLFSKKIELFMRKNYHAQYAAQIHRINEKSQQIIPYRDLK